MPVFIKYMWIQFSRPKVRLKKLSPWQDFSLPFSTLLVTEWPELCMLAIYSVAVFSTLRWGNMHLEYFCMLRRPRILARIPQNLCFRAVTNASWFLRTLHWRTHTQKLSPDYLSTSILRESSKSNATDTQRQSSPRNTLFLQAIDVYARIANGQKTYSVLVISKQGCTLLCSGTSSGLSFGFVQSTIERVRKTNVSPLI